MHTFHTSCPVKETSQETFFQWVTVGGERQRATFERMVLWLQESEANVALFHEGVLIEHLATFNDHYGYLTSCSADVGHVDLATWAESYKIKRSSTLELRMTCTVFLRPAIETEECAEFNRANKGKVMPKYATVPDDWRKELTQEGGEAITDQLQRVELGSGTVWSSKHTPEENAALLEAFRAKHAITQERPDAST